MEDNVKSPGLQTTPVTAKLDLSYTVRYAKEEIFVACTQLILEVICGCQVAFVQCNELKAAWAINTPLLHWAES